MTKYFLAGTNDELEMGDIIEVLLTKELKNGKKKYEKVECKFTEETLPYLLDMEIVEERETDDLIDFDDDLEVDEAWEEMTERISELEDRVTELEGIIADRKK
jgi:hypothetical protein